MTWLARLVAAVAIALAGGSIGTLLVLRVWEKTVFDAGDFFGTITAAIAATFLAYHFGLRDFLLRRSREEVSRRFLDAGLDAVGTAMVKGLELALTDAQIVATMIEIAAHDVPVDDPAYVDTAKRLQSGGGLTMETFRVASAFGDVRLLAAFAKATAIVRDALQFYCSVVPWQLSNIRSRPVDQRTVALTKLIEELHEHVRKVNRLYAVFPIVVVNLSEAVQKCIGRESAVEPEDVATAPAVVKCMNEMIEAIEKVAPGERPSVAGKLAAFGVDSKVSTLAQKLGEPPAE